MENQRDTESQRLRELREHPRLTGDSWVYFREELSKLDPQTEEGYLRQFTAFLEDQDLDTESLFDQYLEMRRDQDPRVKKRMGMLVTDFQRRLAESTGIKLVSTLNVYKSVKLFFTANELDFEINGSIVQDDSDELPNISQEQLNAVLEATGSYRIKAVIHLAKDSGLRIGDITNLTIGKVKPIWDDPTYEQVEGYPGFYQFDVVQEKTNQDAYPVIGPETAQALQAWKAEREDRGLSDDDDDDPLFCCVKTVRGYTRKNGIEVKGSNAGDYLDESTLGVIFSRLVRKAKITRLPGEKRKPSIHSLRKYHKTNLENARIPTAWVYKLQGRSMGSGQTYTKPSVDQLVEMYASGYYSLSLSPDEEVVTSALDDMKERLEIQRDESAEYQQWAREFREESEAKDQEIERLKAKMERMEKLLEALASKNGVEA